MKLPVILSYLVVIAATEDCSWVKCRDLVVEADRPINRSTIFQWYCSKSNCLDKPFRKLGLNYVRGSLGVDTFSSVPQIEELEITHSNITSVESGAICAPRNLRKLTVERNSNFPVLTESLLTNCIKLANLSIISAGIDPSAFKSMENLENLKLDRIYIKNFTRQYLEPASKLKSLRLENMHIENIEDGVLCLSPHLDFLSIDAVNPLTIWKSSVFQNCSSVKTLEFFVKTTENIAMFSEPFGTDTFLNVRQVSLSGLHLNRLSKGRLKGLQNAETLKIEHCFVRAINADFFSDFKNLKNLSLSDNMLMDIEQNLAPYLPNLIQLDLNYNRLITIDNIIHPNLEVLLLDSNCIQDIDLAAVKVNLPKLQKLWLSCNMFDVIGEEMERELPAIAGSEGGYPHDSRFCSRHCLGDFSYLYQ